MVDAKPPKFSWRPELDIYDSHFLLNRDDQPDTERIDVKAYAEKLTADNGFITQFGLSVRDVDWLAAGLEFAARWYFFGRDLEKSEKGGKTFIKQLRSEGLNEVAELIKKAPPNRPASYSLKAFSWIMADLWEEMGGRVGTAYDGEGGEEYWEKAGDAVSRFQHFASNWLDAINSSLVAADPSNTTDPAHHHKTQLTRKRVRDFINERRAAKNLPLPKKGRPSSKSPT